MNPNADIVEDVIVTVGGVTRRLQVRVDGIPLYVGDHLLELRWSAESESEFEERFAPPMLISVSLSLLFLALRGQMVDGVPLTEDWLLDNAPTWRLFSDTALVFRARERWAAALSDALRVAFALHRVHEQEALDTEVNDYLHVMEKL